MMNADVTVLSSRGIAGAHRVSGDCVQRTEVALDTANLILEDLVVKAGFELSLSGIGGSNVHGCLTTAENYIVFLCGDGCGVEGGVCHVGFEDSEVSGGDDLVILELAAYSLEG